VPLEGAQVIVAQVGQAQAMAPSGEEPGQPAQLTGIGADGVGAAVGLQLKPTDVLVRCRLDVDSDARL
jgi:hypothetical protein